MVAELFRGKRFATIMTLINNKFIIFIIIIIFLNTFSFRTIVAQSIPAWNVTSCPVSESEEKCINRTYRTCETMCAADGTCEIRIGILLPTNTSYIVHMEKALENLKEAEVAARNMGLFPPNTTIKYYEYDDRCDPQFATIGALYSYTEACVHAIFGLVCNYPLASVSRIAKFLGNYGTPLLTSGGFATDFTTRKISCDDEYFMTVNTGMIDFTSFSEFLLFIMQKYEWKRIAILYLKSDLYEVGGSQSSYLLAKAIVNELSSLIIGLDYLDGDIEMSALDYKTFLADKVGVKYGIISVCGSYEHVREMLITAAELGMMDRGEYIFIVMDVYNRASVPSQPWYDPNDSYERNDRAKKAYKSTLILSPSIEASYTKQNSAFDDDREQIFLDAVYDGMLLYANALNKLIEIDEDGYAKPNQTIKGNTVVSKLFGMEIEGRRKNITINCNGIRVAEYALLQLNESESIDVVAYYSTRSKTVEYIRNISWVAGEAPSAIPKCGYNNSKCPSEVNIVLIVVCISSGIALTILSVFLYRHYKLETEIASMTWKVYWEDIVWLPSTRGRSSYSTESLGKRMSIMTYQSEMEGFSLAGDRQIYIPIAFFKGIRVAVKKLQDNKIELNRAQLLELKVMKDLSNDHLVKFYGACLESPHCCILTEYCPRGSLEDILENEKVKLDLLFRMSLIQDITRGMQYLHASDIKSHGSLKSSNCVVDSRFTLKITDFGLHFFRTYAQDDFTLDENSHSYWQRQLWTAPELLRMENAPKEGTQKGDVYSFAIIMHEIVTRQGVFYLGEGPNSRMTPKG